MTTTLSKRNFCLMLSSQTGQDVAKQLGFAPASKDVEELELGLIEQQWETLHHFGIFDEIVESVEWFSQVLEKTNSTEGQTSAMIESAKTVIMSYSMSLIQKLISNNKVALMYTVEYDDDCDRDDDDDEEREDWD